MATYNDGYHEYATASTAPASTPSDSGLYTTADARFDKMANMTLSAVQYPTEPNIAPKFGSAMTMRFVLENAAVNNPVGKPVTATDGNGPDDALEYTLGGANGAFSISPGTGQLLTSMEFDHESKYKYTVTVTATDTHNATASITVNIYVVDVDEMPEILEGGLSISGSISVSRMENSDVADALGTYTATGVDAASATWMLAGDDADDFMVEGSGESVMLKFQNSPDFEAPADADGDNIYEVILEATDGTYMASRDVTVTVINEDEDGTVTIDSESPVVGIEVSADLTDPDGGVSGTTWQWASAGDDGEYSDIQGATSPSYIPASADVGRTLQATATYNDDQGTGKSAMDVTDNAVVELTITGDGTATNDENVATVGTYTASVSGATLSLSGDDAGLFGITGGVLSFNTAPDFENPADMGGDNVYNVTVVASYGTAPQAEIAVEVTVTNVNEAPMFAMDMATLEVAENTAAGMAYRRCL